MLRGLLGLAVLLGAAYVVAYVAVGSGIARGTTVLGVPIGEQSRSDAVRTLERELEAAATSPMPVRVGAVTSEIDPVEAGLALDASATVDAAPARSWNPVELLDAVLGGDEVEPVVRVDRPLVRAAVDALAAEVDQEAVEGAVSLRGVRVVEKAPQDGVVLSRPEAVDAVVRAYLDQRSVRGTGALDLPTEVEAPVVDRTEVDRVVAEVAAPAVSAPVLVSVQSASVALEPRDIGRALSFAPDAEGSLQPALDGEVLRSALAEELAPVEKPPRDATFAIRNGRPRVVKSKQGKAVRPESLAAAVLPALTRTGSARTVSVALEVSEPDLDTATARSLNVDELVTEYTTYYPSDFAPRLTNIHTAAEYMDDTLVLPGKVFSLNRTVGERTAARGFAAGFIINNGRLEVDYGGGVSQLATTTFNAAFFAGLEILEHHPHSFYISRYPEGRESTVAWGVKDVRFRNDSDDGIFITTAYTNSSVTVRVYGTKRYQIEATKSARYDYVPYQVIRDPRPAGIDPGDCVATEGVSGFRVVVNRLFFQGGEQLRSEVFRTRYLPEHEVSCGAVAQPEPDPQPDEPDPDETTPDETTPDETTPDETTPTPSR